MASQTGITRTDVIDGDFVDAQELKSDGTAAYLTTTGTSTTSGTSTVVVTLASDGEGILYSKDHPVEAGDIAIISGSSGADGTYHVATIPTDTSFTTVESIPTSTGGTVTFYYPAGALSVGFDPTGMTYATHTNVQKAIQDLDAAISGSGGNVQCIRYAITTAATQTSITNIPANAIVRRAYVEIDVLYSPGTAMQVGQTGSPNLLMSSSDIYPTVSGAYEAIQDTPWGITSLPVLLTVSGSPSVGSGFVVVEYSIPNG